MGEFELIRRYFQHALQPPGVLLGNGDDAALLAPTAGQQLAVSTDMLVQGRHFFADVDAHALGHKALAVNLSDLAAMGAQPLAFTLALALPHTQADWLQAFADGLLALANTHRCALVGGDTTAGPLTISITVMGEVPAHLALRRDAAQVGDDIYVSGQVGDARLALDHLLGQHPLPAAVLARARQRLERPTPHVALGLALRGLAHACADVSDGLLSDLTHILRASGVTAQLDVDALLNSAAISPDLRTQPLARTLTCALAGGDDYELILTAPATQRAALAQVAAQTQVPLTRIGHVVATAPSTPPGTTATTANGMPWVDLRSAQGARYALPSGTALRGFDHFAQHPVPQSNA